MKYKVESPNSSSHFMLEEMVGYHAQSVHDNDSGNSFIHCVVFLRGGHTLSINFSNPEQAEALVDAWLRATEKTRTAILGPR